MKKEIKKKTVNQENDWVDVHNDKLMVSLGIRVPSMESRDSSVWTKTKNEKRILKNVKHVISDGHFHTIPETKIPVRSKLIIYLKKNNKFGKTTYSTECWQHEIPSIINGFKVKDSKFESSNYLVVSKYFWNGKTYKATETPFWK